ncbi:alpha/beta-hydrolase, partial [Dacryopinax primogenitus]
KPVHLNFHGSGFIFPSLGSNHLACTLLARQTGAIVLDCDYRKGPKKNEEGRFDGRVTVSGFSAGGTLALALVGNLEEGVQVQGVTVFYPPVDCSVPFRKKVPPPPGPGGPNPIGDLELMRLAYLGDWNELRDPRLSPAFCEPGKFPDKGRTLLLSVEQDWLDAECRAFGERLDEAGRGVVRIWEKGVGHGFDVFCSEGTGEAERRDRVYREMVLCVK